MKVNKTIARLGVCLMMLAGFTANANAQEETTDDKVTMDALSIAPGEETEVAVNFESSKNYCSFQMTIVLPEGLSYVPYEEDGEEWLFEKGTACGRNHTLEALESQRIPGGYLVVAYSTKFVTLKTGGTLVKFKVKADESLAEKTEILFKEVKLGAEDASESGKEFEFTAEVTNSATAIRDINAAEKSEGVNYNIAGQRISKDVKGLHIVNGKKYINR